MDNTHKVQSKKKAGRLLEIESVRICHRRAGPPEKSMEEKGFLEEPTWAARAVRVERRLFVAA